MILINFENTYAILKFYTSFFTLLSFATFTFTLLLFLATGSVNDGRFTAKKVFFHHELFLLDSVSDFIDVPTDNIMIA